MRLDLIQLHVNDQWFPDEDIAEGHILLSAAINGVDHNVQLIRVRDVQDLDGNTVQTPWGTEAYLAERYEGIQKFFPGYQYAIHIDGLPDKWLCIIHPCAD